MYRDFIVDILRALNPRHEAAGTILFDEFESCNEVFFIHKGEVGLGFTVNMQTYFALSYKDKAVLGGYNATFS